MTDPVAPGAVRTTGDTTTITQTEALDEREGRKG